MAQEKQTPPGGQSTIVRGAQDQLAALEELWAQGEQSDPQADDAAWQTLRRALNKTRRAAGARVLYTEDND